MHTKILLADDHAILREGLRAVLEREADLKVVGEAGDGREAVAMANQLCPDVVVMDVGMPGLNGVEATRQLRTQAPEVKVIALSAYADKQFVLAMLEAGARGYVVKASGSDEVLRAVRAVIQGRKYLCPEAAKAVVDGYVGKLQPDQKAAHTVLTKREREVLQLVAEGKSSKAIGEELKISFHTVEIHRRNLMQKLSLHTTAELTKYAVRHGFTSA
jgi:DNA-binding NarL/FixJ family response regulator